MKGKCFLVDLQLCSKVATIILSYSTAFIPLNLFYCYQVSSQHDGFILPRFYMYVESLNIHSIANVLWIDIKRAKRVMKR